MSANITNVTDEYSNNNGIESQCLTLKICGVVMLLVLICSLFSNSLVIWIFCATKELKNPTYLILSCICLINLVPTLTELPNFIVNLFYCG